MKKRTYLITAAGGNGTAIRVLDNPMSRTEYAREGKRLGHTMEQYGAEQTGFLVLPHNHLEMSGGEFCGNASRAAAVLLWRSKDIHDVSFTTSGYSGVVRAKVIKINDRNYDVECVFDGLPTDSKEATFANGGRATIVDLGGIVHVILEATFPAGDPSLYQDVHRRITRELGLENRSAVGVVWFERLGKSIKMHPVVWVKNVDTFFYEQSCGSGTIALSKVTGAQSIVQPTGQSIEVRITDVSVTLRSKMEITQEDD